MPQRIEITASEIPDLDAVESFASYADLRLITTEGSLFIFVSEKGDVILQDINALCNFLKLIAQRTGFPLRHIRVS